MGSPTSIIYWSVDRRPEQDASFACKMIVRTNEPLQIRHMLIDYGYATSIADDHDESNVSTEEVLEGLEIIHHAAHIVLKIFGV